MKTTSTIKQLITLCLLTACFACASKQPQEPEVVGANQVSKESIPQKATAKSDTIDVKADEAKGYEISTYDYPQYADIDQHKEKLKQLSDNRVFLAIHSKLIPTLNERHQKYFRSNSTYELLSFAKGDLFQNAKDDHAFIAYDKARQRILILVYNDLTNKYYELYRDLKIKDRLKSAECNYGADLDYGLGEEINYLMEYLIKKPESYLESSPCKIADLAKDETFVIADGCLLKQVAKTSLKNSLCISTSSVYNNWKCLKYDALKNEFYIYYAQAYAD
ncbi:hypothetical protein FAM09_28990 [Niastella caeni]|uniref:Lipoprotein n=1 Tax=Niastella caeni TaxID=2569763 RepID=A0A4S8HER9_9BACT|nr:hypothetical protein [Niastella caeni]THU31122.1 hypothetical protein FAM09_28990 [Niastella caeni]